MSSDSGSGGSSDEEEQHDAANPQVTGANADPAILQLFWDLAALEQEERQTAAEALVTALVNSQKQHDAQHRAADSQPPGSLEQQAAAAAAGGRQQRMEDALQCCSSHMAYGLKRLARGLASGRQGARQGFAAALAATLAHAAAGAAGSQQSPLQQPFVSAAGVLALLDASLEVTGSMKGSDQRDTLLGRVFGLAALSRSGLVTAFPAAAAAGDAANACVALVAEQLVALLQRKSFLRESAAAALVELLQPLSRDQMKQVVAQAPRLTSLLQLPAASASPEGLLLALRLWHNLPPATLQHCQLLPALPPSASPPPELFWQQPGAVPRGAVTAAAAGVFAAGHVQQLVPVLLATSGSYPRLHPVWGCLLALLVPGFVPVKVAAAADNAPSQQQQQQRAAPDLQQLSSLWQHFVEGACFSSSHERKALALQLLQLLLPVLTPEAVPVVLSRQLLGCLDTAVRDRDSYLHVSAKKCLDRLQQCAEHSMVVKGDAAQAAKLRMVLAAALQSHPRLQTAGSGSGKAAAKQQLLQGLDAAGIAAYVDQLSAALVEAVAGQQGRTGAAAANGSAGGDGLSSDEEDDEGKAEDAGVDDSKARQLLDQLSAALRFPAADSSTLCKGLSFLAAAAFLRLPASLDAAALGSLIAGGAAPAAGDGSKKSSKKGKKSKEASSNAAADGQLQAEQQVLQLASGMQPGPSQQLRQQCAARLISLLHSLQHRAAAAGGASSQQQQQQQQDDGDGKQQPGSAPESKKQKKKAQAEREQAAAAAAKQAAWQQQEAVTTRLLQFVAAAGQLPGVETTADEDIVEMVAQLQQLEAIISRHAAASLQQQGEQQPGRGAAAATRLRMSLQLVHQLQLQLLSGGLAAEAAGSVVDDLEASLVRGLGLPTIDRAAAAAAALARSGSDDDGGGGSSSGDDDEDDEEEGAPAWQDVLLDLLLSLLSSSSAEGGAGGGGSGRGAAVAVPTAPLREACEGLFRVFAEDMTAQGLSDLLRILTQRASEVLKQRDEEDSEVEQSEEEDEQSEEEDEQSGDDEDAADAGGDAPSEEEEEEAEEGGKAAAAAAGNGTAAGGDGSSDEGDAASDLDDDAMLRLDAQLGAAVRGMLARGGGSARERAAALLALQLRVAALLEEWLKKCPRSPLVVQVALPLLKALVAARGAGGNPTLADRLAGLVNKHLSRCRPVLAAADAAAAAGSDDDDEQQQRAAGAAAAGGVAAGLQGDVRKVLYYASREKDPRVAAAAGQALLVLLAAASEAGGATAAIAQEAAAAALTDFFEKKKTRLQRPWCEQLLSRCPEALLGGADGSSGSSSALGVLLAAVAKARNDSVRAKAVQLLPVLLRSPSAKQAAAVLAALRQQQAAVAAAVGAAVTGPYKAKDQHAAAVKAVVQLLQAVQKAGGADKRLAELLGPETVRELGKAVVVVKAAGVAPRVESQLDRLVSVAGLQQLVAAGKADPARLALLKKNRAALEGKAAAGKAAAAAAAADAPKQQQQQKQQAKQKKQKQLKQQQADAPAAMEVDGDEPEAAAAAAGGSKQEAKKHKKDKHKKEQRDAAAEQQDGEQQQAKKRKKQQQGDASAAAGREQSGAGKRKAGKGDGEQGKKKHKQKPSQ